MSAHTLAAPDGSGDRDTLERARYIERTTPFDRRVALALAYTERGFSSHGVASKIDATPGTVSTYLDRVTARYGPPAVLRRGDDVGELEPVDPSDVLGWSDHYRTWWLDAAREHPDVVPSDAREHL